MQFTPFTAFAIFATIWWTVLFVVLPFGVVSHAEAGIDKGDGGDPGAPVDPKLKKKFITTTVIATCIFAVLYVALTFFHIGLPRLPSGY